MLGKLDAFGFHVAALHGCLREAADPLCDWQ
jgi:hypothetical protein